MLSLRPYRLAALGSLVLVLAAGAAPGPAPAAAPVHLRLVRTVPAADTTLATSPAEIRLVFSEAPQAPSASVRLTGANDALVATSAVAPDSQDPKQLFVRPSAPLPAGAYTVHWRVLARDGHAQNGTFGFRVTGG